MKFKLNFVYLPGLVLCLALVSFFNISCQYDYSSPLPGILEVRLKSISNNITFDPLNNYVIKVSNVEAIRNDGVRTVIFEDLRATQRTTNVYNTLDVRARDGNLVMGQTYVSPGSYSGLTISIEGADAVIRDGYRIIPVEYPEGNAGTLISASPYEVRESATTLITVVVNLDSTLLQRANTYRFRPFFYISPN